MKILVSEKLSEHKFKDNNGYLICTNCVLSRTGPQTYRRNELYDDGSDEEVEVNRTADEVFSSEALASFENCPVCIEHPEVDVNPENHNELSVGFVRNVKKGTDNGEDVMLGDLVITDANAIDLIESGEMTELSCGYNCDISDEETPQQLNIRGNHVALCEKGRAGIARIVDSIDDEDEIKVLKQKGTNALIWIKNAKLNPYVIVNHFEEKTKTWRNGTYYSDYEKAKKDFNKTYDSIDDEDEKEYLYEIEYIDKKSDNTTRALITAKSEDKALELFKKYYKGQYYRINNVFEGNVIDDSQNDPEVDYLELEKKIKDAKSRSEVKNLMDEVDSHMENGSLTKTEYLKLVKLGETTKDSITTHRIRSIINLIK